jgi:hypothetical protein
MEVLYTDLSFDDQFAFNNTLVNDDPLELMLELEREQRLTAAREALQGLLAEGRTPAECVRILAKRFMR